MLKGKICDLFYFFSTNQDHFPQNISESGYFKQTRVDNCWNQDGLEFYL